MAELVPAISTRTELAKDAIPLSKHPMEVAGPSPAMTGLARRSASHLQVLLCRTGTQEPSFCEILSADS
jgi:hypothetical protein